MKKLVLIVLCVLLLSACVGNRQPLYVNYYRMCVDTYDPDPYTQAQCQRQYALIKDMEYIDHMPDEQVPSALASELGGLAHDSINMSYDVQDSYYCLKHPNNCR